MRTCLLVRSSTLFSTAAGVNALPIDCFYLRRDQVPFSFGSLLPVLSYSAVHAAYSSRYIVHSITGLDLPCGSTLSPAYLMKIPFLVSH